LQQLNLLIELPLFSSAFPLYTSYIYIYKHALNTRTWNDIRICIVVTADNGCCISTLAKVSTVASVMRDK